MLVKQNTCARNYLVQLITFLAALYSLLVTRYAILPTHLHISAAVAATPIQIEFSYLGILIII